MAVSARRFTCSFGHSGVSACKPLNTQRLSAFSFVMAVEDLVAQAVRTRAADLARSARLFVLKADQGAPGLTRSRVSVRAAGTWYSRRTLGLDVLACPRCGWRLRLIALIEIPSLLERFLPHLGLSTAMLDVRPARPQSLPFDGPARRRRGPNPHYSRRGRFRSQRMLIVAQRRHRRRGTARRRATRG